MPPAWVEIGWRSGGDRMEIGWRSGWDEGEREEGWHRVGQGERAGGGERAGSDGGEGGRAERVGEQPGQLRVSEGHLVTVRVRVRSGLGLKGQGQGYR